ncbi:MAG: exo-alpha-sialidase, partial [Acidobacteriota bacterium]|nr:exo-alpha-sialidase [Acidobacteriota bacterium]
VFREKSGGYFTHRIPALLVTGKGALLAFCEGRRGSASDSAPTDILLRRSLDGGNTWGPVQVVASFARDTVGNPTPVYDRRTRTILLLMTRSPAGVSESEIMAGKGRGSKTVWITRSADEGAHWSRLENITSSAKRGDSTWYATGPGNGIQMRDGRLVIPCDHAVAGGHHYWSHVIYSDSDGKTWKIGGSAGPDTNESAVVELANGDLILNMRSYAGHYRRAIAYSHDGGVTWSPVHLDPALVEPVCEASLIRYSLAATGGRNRLLFSNPADIVRDRMTVRLSYDEGQTWPVSRMIYKGPSGYSSLAVLKDRTIGLLYERSPEKNAGLAGEGPGIVFAHFNLDWLTRGKDSPRGL